MNKIKSVSIKFIGALLILNKLLGGIAEKLKQKQNYLLVASLFFILGIILGFSLKCENDNELFLENTVNFFIVTLSSESNPFRLLFIRIIADCGFFIVFAITARIYLTYAFHFVFLLFRGYVLGVAAVTFTITFGVLGVIVFVFAIVIQNVITSIGLVVFSALALETLEVSKKCKTFNYNSFFYSMLIGFVISLIGIVIESLIIVIIIRPTIIYF